MTDVNSGVDLDLDDESDSRGRSKLKLYAIILVGIIVVIGAGGAVWYFLLGGKAYLSPPVAKTAEAPLPFLLDLKPFVVSVPSRAGPTHFVQMGLSFQLPGSSAGNLITAILPQVQDTLRRSVLNFKSEDLQSPDGIDRVRAAMLTDLNKALAQDLGADRIRRVDPGRPPDTLVRNIYFSQLIVE